MLADHLTQITANRLPTKTWLKHAFFSLVVVQGTVTVLPTEQLWHFISKF